MDAALPVAQRRFDHLHHFGSDQGENEMLERKVPHLGAGGLFSAARADDGAPHPQAEQLVPACRASLRDVRRQEPAAAV